MDMIKLDDLKAYRDDRIASGDSDFDEMDRLSAFIANVETIEPKRGEWIYGEHDVAMCDGYRCDRCGFFVPWDYEHKFIDFINDYHFCPNCGARMKGADDER